MGGRIYYSHGDHNARGTSILIKKKSQIKIKHIHAHKDGRWLILQTIIGNSEINLCNVYAPNDDNPQFFIDFFELISSLPGSNIIGGDWNLVLKIQIDKSGGTNQTHRRSLEVVKTYKEVEFLSDIWRIQHPTDKVYTWGMTNCNRIYERLDFFLVSDQLLDNITHTDIIPAFMSDHAIPIINYECCQQKRGPGFWKLNISLLEDTTYIEKTNEILQEILDNHEYDSNSQKWEMMKMKVREHSIQYASRKKKSRNNILLALEHKLKRLEQELINQDTHHATRIFTYDNNSEERDKVKAEIEKIIDYRTKGAIIRSRRNWLQLGEKSSKYFFNLERYNYMAKNRFKLRNKHGAITTNAKEILNIQKEFYKQLYTTSGVILSDKYLENLDAPKLSQAETAHTNEVITTLEIRNAIKQLAKQKCPGNDGFPIEWYQFFYDKLKMFLLSLFREISRYGLPESSKKGIISLLEKPDRDQLSISQWRPLSLLNCDGKIYAKILANRINEVISNITSKEQYGFIKGKYIGENILELISTIDYCNKKNIPAIIVSLDLEKAFDKVEWQSLTKILKFFGFGDNFCYMVEMLYHNTTSCTINNGYTSEYFPLQRALRQGCPLSPPAFVLMGEILCLKIKQNHNIIGINIKEVAEDYTKKLAQYADDLWASLLGTDENVRTFFNEVQEFTNNTGLTVNYNKTQIMRIGSLRDSNAKFYSEKQLIWSDCIKVLGIDIYADTDQLILNYDKVTNKIRKVFDSWNVRSLSTIGKILIVNSLATSQMIYKLFVIASPPKTILTQIKQMIRCFIWESKRPLIAYDTLVKPIASGGLNLTDMAARDMAIKSSWIKRSMTSTADWIYIANAIMPVDLPFIWECNINPKDIEKIKIESSTWKSIWQTWAKLTFFKPKNYEQILNQIMWYNTFVIKEGKPFISYKMYKKGIKKVSDIYMIEQKKFKTFVMIQQEFNVEKEDFIEYASLIASIPCSWKKELKIQACAENEITDKELIMNEIIRRDKITKYMYQHALSKSCANMEDTAYLIWNVNLGTEYSKDDWAKIRTDSFYLTLSVKLRYFQFRLLSNRITTNYERSKWDKNISPNCQQCNTLMNPLHILVECKIAKKIWEALAKWLKYMCNIELQVDARTIVINNYKGTYAPLTNTIILITKQHLYAANCLGETPRITSILDKIKDLYYVEWNIAQQNENMTKHTKKWAPIINIIV